MDNHSIQRFPLVQQTSPSDLGAGPRRALAPSQAFFRNFSRVIALPVHTQSRQGFLAVQ